MVNHTVDKELVAQLRQSALVMLSRREYSRAELEQRLGRQEGAAPLLEEVLERLREQGLQSDERFAESLLRSRISRGQGPLRITQELRNKGVDESIREEVLGGCEQDWFELARSVRERRFGLEPPEDAKMQAKQWRFLVYRGFSQDQTRYALSAAESE